jgi:ubiquinone/menaquinone biosynthesis C-methylase UbiE
MTKNGYSVRNVRYEEVHRIKPEDFDALVVSLDLEEGQVIGDFCSGYGAVTREVLARKDKIKPILVDRSPKQISRSYEELPNEEVSRIISDIRDLPFRDSYFDRIALKMGLQEMPLSEQQRALNEVYRVLRSGGIFSLWNVIAPDEVEQGIFQAVIHEKDRLAGFDSMAIGRYLQREDQLREMLQVTGFADVELVHEISYFLRTSDRLNTEFEGDITRLREWNQFIKSHIPQGLRYRFSYDEDNDNITIRFRQGILRAVKSPLDSKNERDDRK